MLSRKNFEEFLRLCVLIDSIEHYIRLVMVDIDLKRERTKDLLLEEFTHAVLEINH